MDERIWLTVIIPAFNEETRLPKTLEETRRYLETQAYAAEVIVVDDGSTDGTCRVAGDMLARIPHGRLLENGRNRGKGYSVRHGVLASRGAFVLFMDADMSTPLREVEKLFAALQRGYDIAIGSRGLRESDVRVHQPFYRESMGKIFNAFARLFFLTAFHDTQCGFKCFRGDVARELFARQRIDHFSFDVEVLFLAARAGYRIAEVPVQWVNEPHSRVHAVVDSMKMFRDLLGIRLNVWFGRYK